MEVLQSILGHEDIKTSEVNQLIRNNQDLYCYIKEVQSYYDKLRPLHENLRVISILPAYGIEKLPHMYHNEYQAFILLDDRLLYDPLNARWVILNHETQQVEETPTFPSIVPKKSQAKIPFLKECSKSHHVQTLAYTKIEKIPIFVLATWMKLSTDFRRFQTMSRDIIKHPNIDGVSDYRKHLSGSFMKKYNSDKLFYSLFPEEVRAAVDTLKELPFLESTKVVRYLLTPKFAKQHGIRYSEFDFEPPARFRTLSHEAKIKQYFQLLQKETEETASIGAKAILTVVPNIVTVFDQPPLNEVESKSLPTFTGPELLRILDSRITLFNQ